MNILIGTLIVGATVFLLLKQYDFRVVLIASGLLLAGIALDPLTVLDEFAYKMVTDSLIKAVCSAIGFAYVMKETGCQKSLIALLAPRLSGWGKLLIPLTVILTFAINSVLMSAANTAAAAGIVFIPILISSGVRPVIAASAVLAGTFGSMLNPGLPTNAFVARVAAVEVETVAEVQSIPALCAMVIAAVCLTVWAILRDEYRNHQGETTESFQPAGKNIFLHGAIPLVPLIILVLGASGWVPVLRIGIVQAMLVGALLGLLVTRTSSVVVSERFFSGMGAAYAQAMGMIIAVAVFVRGMKSIGLVSYFITQLTTTPELAKIGGILGPFIMGIMTGSGDAAAFAFSEAVAPHAFLYDMNTVDMGSMAAIAGALGRTMSPFAGAAIVCAMIAEVNPLEVAKRNGLGMVFALAAVFIII